MQPPVGGARIYEALPVLVRTYTFHAGRIAARIRDMGQQAHADCFQNHRL